ncbi:hypothetical protein MRB53_037501 [Persea americana]|nr:hypothetical protein MRB53_037501 [Persea americana]
MAQRHARHRRPPGDRLLRRRHAESDIRGTNEFNERSPEPLVLDPRPHRRLQAGDEAEVRAAGHRRQTSSRPSGTVLRGRSRRRSRARRSRARGRVTRPFRSLRRRSLKWIDRNGTGTWMRMMMMWRRRFDVCSSGSLPRTRRPAAFAELTGTGEGGKRGRGQERVAVWLLWIMAFRALDYEGWGQECDRGRIIEQTLLGINRDRVRHRRGIDVGSFISCRSAMLAERLACSLQSSATPRTSSSSCLYRISRCPKHVFCFCSCSRSIPLYANCNVVAFPRPSPSCPLSRTMTPR